MIFEANRTSIVEFEWVESFEWGSDILFKHTVDGVEPQSAFKAMNGEGFFIWRASEDDEGQGTDKPSDSHEPEVQAINTPAKTRTARSMNKRITAEVPSFDDSSLSEIESRRLLQKEDGRLEKGGAAAKKPKIYLSRRNKVHTSVGYEEMGGGVRKIEELDHTSFKPYEMYADYRKNFEDLVKVREVPTESPIVFMMLNLRSTRVLAVLKVSESEYQVKAWCLATAGEVYSKSYGGAGSYIKMSIID